MSHDTDKKKVLHVGCGSRTTGILHNLFKDGKWSEVRLDIDPLVKPDIVNSITDMIDIGDEAVDAVYSSHNLEHLFPHEVPVCLKEFIRVLKPSGFALIGVPDLQAVAKLIADDKLEETAYQSPAGPVAPIDMVYGYRPSLAQGNLFMAHKTGFTPKSLGQVMINSGFAWAKYATDNRFGLWIKGYKAIPSQDIQNRPLW